MTQETINKLCAILVEEFGRRVYLKESPSFSLIEGPNDVVPGHKQFALPIICTRSSTELTLTFEIGGEVLYKDLDY